MKLEILFCSLGIAIGLGVTASAQSDSKLKVPTTTPRQDAGNPAKLPPPSSNFSFPICGSKELNPSRSMRRYRRATSRWSSPSRTGASFRRKHYNRRPVRPRYLLIHALKQKLRIDCLRSS